MRKEVSVSFHLYEISVPQAVRSSWAVCLPPYCICDICCMSRKSYSTVSEFRKGVQFFGWLNTSSIVPWNNTAVSVEDEIAAEKKMSIMATIDALLTLCFLNGIDENVNSVLLGYVRYHGNYLCGDGRWREQIEWITLPLLLGEVQVFSHMGRELCYNTHLAGLLRVITSIVHRSAIVYFRVAKHYCVVEETFTCCYTVIIKRAFGKYDNVSSALRSLINQPQIVC